MKYFINLAFFCVSLISVQAFSQTPIQDERLTGVLNSLSIESGTIIVSDRPFLLSSNLRVVNEAGRVLPITALSSNSRVNLTLDSNRVTVITVLR